MWWCPWYSSKPPVSSIVYLLHTEDQEELPEVYVSWPNLAQEKRSKAVACRSSLVENGRAVSVHLECLSEALINPVAYKQRFISCRLEAGIPEIKGLADVASGKQLAPDSQRGAFSPQPPRSLSFHSWELQTHSLTTYQRHAGQERGKHSDLSNMLSWW